jgi:uncharacterized protein YdeI (YjbR/CyaY-like superfamily)
MDMFKDLQVLLFNNKEDWRAWLENNHEQSPGLWLKHAKKSFGKKSVSYEEALQEALCYYAFSWRIQTAKKPETKKARIEKFIDMLNRGEKLH